ncbi:sensor histidine kinase [Actinomadura litoris]|uniref:histidine kinase n=1 Tax=Actinomadura litoris TaxID=2678616 RepID=A0A7K1KUV3_9ACTN|nr:sensor histidine kinase [Actinomadura litoris]MUN35726.1 sensor histidine kinase [Actinomadura litoris]
MGQSRFPRGRRADAIVAAAAFALDLAELLIRAVGHAPSGRMLLVAAGLAAAAAALTARRRHPVATLVIVVAFDLLRGALAGSWSDSISTVSLVALYNAGRYLPVARGWAAGGGAVALLAVPVTVRTGAGGLADELLTNFLVVVVGQLMAAREELTRRHRAQAVEAAVHDERRRIARELHDVVAHHIGVMNALVGAARTTMTRAPEESREALEAAERTAREAMVEMREMLAVLRAEDGTDTGGGEPATAGGVAALVRRAGETGVPAALEVSGVPRPLPSSVDRAVYRVAQEALTNVRKHAGGARATVHLRYAPDAVGVEITDDGPGSGPPEEGHGLRGMAERVALCGGTMRAAPRPEGGFRVAAHIPLPSPADHDAGAASPGRPR